jgi:long-chain acyl-CoA synthetase
VRTDRQKFGARRFHSSEAPRSRTRVHLKKTMNVCDYLLNGRPEVAPALLTLQGEYTYAQLQKGASSVAAFLVNWGSRKGDRAILVAESTFFWVAAYLGILRAGLVCVPMAPGSTKEELEYIFEITEPSCAFVDSKRAGKVPDRWRTTLLITDVPVPLANHSSVTSLANVQNGDAGSIPLPEIGQDDLAALMFTSGSTGKPRGVMVSHGNIIANTDSIIEYLALTSCDRIMAVLPFHYCFGTSLLHTHLRVGGCVVVDTRFMYPEVVLHRMQAAGCTGFAGVPSHFQILLRKSKLAKMSFPKLRYVQQAGGQLPPIFIKELRNALPDKQIFIMYGQTEATARLSYLPPEMLDTKLGSVGKGIPGVRLAVLDENGRPVKPGETGEIVAEGGNVGLGYWHDEEETSRSFRNGKLYTGDLATVDTDGFIFIVDRAKDFLKCGGKRVSCRYIENALLGYEEVLEASIVGVPDEVLGEAAIAFIVPRDLKSSPTSEQLQSYCRQNLSPQFVPRDFVLVSALPKNSSGKVLKPLLKAQALERAAL